MKRITAPLFTAAALVLSAAAARAQTCTIGQIDPVLFPGTGPAPGSTLLPNPDGSITFTWCNANADYFLILESVAGAHDIFFAFAGGVGQGAGVVSVTLGPGCAMSPPTGCIPALGETIFFTLDTLKGGALLGSVQYTFTAPSQAPTSTPTSTPTNTPTRTPTDTPTATPTNTPTGALTNTPTNTPTSTPTATPPTATPSNTPTATPTNTPSGAPTVTNTPAGVPTSTPTPNQAAAQNIPTLSRWVQLCLALVLAGLGYLSLRNR